MKRNLVLGFGSLLMVSILLANAACVASENKKYDTKSFDAKVSTLPYDCNISANDKSGVWDYYF